MSASSVIGMQLMILLTLDTCVVESVFGMLGEFRC